MALSDRTQREVPRPVAAVPASPPTPPSVLAFTPCAAPPSLIVQPPLSHQSLPPLVRLPTPRPPPPSISRLPCWRAARTMRGTHSPHASHPPIDHQVALLARRPHNARHAQRRLPQQCLRHPPLMIRQQGLQLPQALRRLRARCQRCCDGRGSATPARGAAAVGMFFCGCSAMRGRPLAWIRCVRLASSPAPAGWPRGACAC